jgi:hypothetical protein
MFGVTPSFDARLFSSLFSLALCDVESRLFDLFYLVSLVCSRQPSLLIVCPLARP